MTAEAAAVAAVGEKAEAVAKEAQAHNLAFADAPVSGGTAAADVKRRRA